MHGALLSRVAGLFLVICVLSGCAVRQHHATAELADAAWQAMLARAVTSAEPFRDTLSLRFGRENDTRRVTALMWGNGTDELRLDVRAGVGATVAMLRQQGSFFLLYAPMERKAWSHQGPASPLLRLGVPLPLDLFRLEALLHNRWMEVFGTDFEAAASDAKGIACRLTGGIGGTLVLTTDGIPARWRDEHWRIDFVFNDDGTLKRLDLANDRGEKGILLVRQREHPAPFTAEQLRLELPPDTVCEKLLAQTRTRD